MATRPPQPAQPKAAPQSFYDRYIRARYHTDPEFRCRVIARSAAYNAAVKDSPEFKARRREAARRYYHAHADYRERKTEHQRQARAMARALSATCALHATCAPPGESL